MLYNENFILVNRDFFAIGQLNSYPWGIMLGLDKTHSPLMRPTKECHYTFVKGCSTELHTKVLACLPKA